MLFIHSFYIPLILYKVEGSWSQSKLTSGQSQETPWTGRQLITRLTYIDKQPFTLTFTLTGNFESQVKLIACFWSVVGNLSTQRKPEQTGGEHASK